MIRFVAHMTWEVARALWHTTVGEIFITTTRNHNAHARDKHD